MDTNSPKTLRMGIDIHEGNYKVAYVDEELRNSEQEEEMSPDQFLDWVTGQIKVGKKVYSCYEAGPLDCTLHLDLKGLGVVNRLIRYKNWEQEDHQDPSKYSASELLEITCALS